MKSKYLNFILLITACIISIYCWNIKAKKYVYNENLININTSSLNKDRIIQIQYIETTYFEGNGLEKKSTCVSYIYPDRIRYDTDNEVEIYNGGKYIYYNNRDNVIKVKQGFKPDEPYVTDIEKIINELTAKDKLEFFGYEEKKNNKFKVVGIKTKSNEHDYLKKIWIGDINGITLPFIVENFIDNSIVYKSEISYLKVNKTIDSSLFDVSSLPDVKIIDDGFIPKTFDNFDKAQKQLKFKILIPKNAPPDFILSEIGIIPTESPAFYCMYFKNGLRIYLNESEKKTDFIKNASIAGLPCSYEIKNDKIAILWKQNNLYVNISGDELVYNEVVSMAEDIAKGKFIKDSILK